MLGSKLIHVSKMHGPQIASVGLRQSCDLTRARWNFHEGYAWWRHQMETSSALLAICAGNSPVSGEFPAQMPVTRSFYVFVDLRRIIGWVNNCEAGDLRRYRAHCDVTVMEWNQTLLLNRNGAELSAKHVVDNYWDVLCVLWCDLGRNWG